MAAAVRMCVFGLLLAWPSQAASPSRDVKALFEQATAAETARQFDKALDCYLKCHLAGERSAVLREHIHDCFRQAAQIRRHGDPAFREYIRALPPAEALNLYAEVIEKLSTHHMEKEKAKPGKLFALGIQEIDRALQQSNFRKQNLAGVSNAKLAAFQQTLKDDWVLRQPASAREARIAMQELVRTAQADIQLQPASSLILEAICGASAGLDEGTTYLPPSQVKEKSTESTISRVEILDAMTGIGLITIRRFRESTGQEFEQAFQRLKTEGLKALVLDLRGNSGGSFPAAISLAGRFVPGGVLVTTMAQVPEFDTRVFSSSSGMMAVDLPLVVLVDAKTMSAAEVFASAVKEQNRATLVGMATFGKGTIQSPLPLESAEEIEYIRKPRSGLLVVSVAKIFQANGTALHQNGVVPHIIEANADSQLRLARERAAELIEMR